MNEQDARATVETMAREYPAAYRLAQAVSLAVRIEPELLRGARLRLLPEIDAGAEADLWFSFLVQSQSPLAMTFLPGITEVLREKLAEDQSLLRSAWKFLEEFHLNAPPALRLEEEVTWLALSGADNSDLIRKRLESVSLAIVQDNRPGLVQWATRALPDLPARARNSDAAHVLSLVATAPGNLRLPESSAKGTVNERLSQIISQTLPRVPVGVRLFTKNPEKIAKPGVLVEFSYPEFESADIIEVPQTKPVLLELSWQGATEKHIERISLQRGEKRRLEVGSSELSIRTALGDVHSLAPRMDYDFFLVYAPVDTDWVISLKERLQREENEGRQLQIYSTVLIGAPNQSRSTGWELPFRTSRKVGLVMSPESVQQDWGKIQQLAAKRLDSSRISDWMIPIHHRPCRIPETLEAAPIDLGEDSDFEQGYRKLLAAITDRPSSVLQDKPHPLRIERRVSAPRATTVNVFVFYDPRDEEFSIQLKTHLKTLKRRGLNVFLQDSRGSEFSYEMEQSIRTSDVVLCLLSPTFLASSASRSPAVTVAVERAHSGKALVIPILVRAVDWNYSAFYGFQALPDGGKPIEAFRNRDEAYLVITRGIVRAIEGLISRREIKPPAKKKVLPRTAPKPAVYRWAIRTATAEDSGRIRPDVVPTTIEELAAQPRPRDMPLKAVRVQKYQVRRAPPVETTKWSVDATITAFKRQPSGGYRLTLEGKDGTTMIAVAHDPEHLHLYSPLASEMAAAVRKLTDKFVFRPSFVRTRVAARVVGLGFFNRWHAQSEGAANAVELQPLLDVEWLEEGSLSTSKRTRPGGRRGIFLRADFHSATGHVTNLDVKGLPNEFARIKPGLTLTIRSVARGTRGDLSLVVFIEGLSSPTEDFATLARDALEESIDSMLPRHWQRSFRTSLTIKEIKRVPEKKSPPSDRLMVGSTKKAKLTRRSPPRSKPIRKGQKLASKKAAVKKNIKKR
ncbi:MAG TPA: toll/interleukin-1 receptor domain-containing protein [Pyrinomonadaceae bacterium]|nr:toll/interleukin-1 receptor domain-containing protein [Pyrinomonadaceae bacterium]